MGICVTAIMVGRLRIWLFDSCDQDFHVLGTWDLEIEGKGMVGSPLFLVLRAWACTLWCSFDSLLVCVRMCGIRGGGGFRYFL